MTAPVLHAILGKALDGLQLRQTATAHNIANAGSPGFVPVRVDFEARLRELAIATAGLEPQARSAEIGRLRPGLAPALHDAGMERGPRIDQEVAIASETSARYAMLIGLLNRSLQIQQLAIRGS